MVSLVLHLNASMIEIIIDIVLFHKFAVFRISYSANDEKWSIQIWIKFHNTTAESFAHTFVSSSRTVIIEHLEMNFLMTKICYGWSMLVCFFSVAPNKSWTLFFLQYICFSQSTISLNLVQLAKCHFYIKYYFHYFCDQSLFEHTYLLTKQQIPPIIRNTKCQTNQFWGKIRREKKPPNLCNILFNLRNRGYNKK